MSEKCFEVGNRCLLFLLNERFLVTLLEAGDATLRVTFPTKDVPIEGMYVQLEFHDSRGYTRYESEVLKAPEGVGDGLLLRRPAEMTRMHHRSSWRVPVSFDAQVKSHVHPRKHSCAALNLSLGGMLFASQAPFALGETVDVVFELPSVGELKMTAKVAHVLEAQDTATEPDRLVGIEFINPDPTHTQAVSHYVTSRIQDRFPGTPRA